MTLHAIIKYCFLEMAFNADLLVVINRLVRALVVELIAALLFIYGTAIFFIASFLLLVKSIGDNALPCTIL